VGYLSNEPRVLRKHSSGYLKARRSPPPAPDPIIPPSNLPLAPMMPEVPIGSFDVLDERPDMLPSIDFGDLREDMD
jgi:hypothetical protein